MPLIKDDGVKMSKHQSIWFMDDPICYIGLHSEKALSVKDMKNVPFLNEGGPSQIVVNKGRF